MSKPISSPFRAIALSTACCMLALANPQPTVSADIARARTLFQHPPREYSTGPLWVWNDLLTEQQIRDTLRDLAQQDVKQVWVHPRPGLMTPYLSADWFRLWKVALQEAKRLDMNVWIYDENSYPSGFAGGLVPEASPESRGRGLEIREVKMLPRWSEEMVGVYQIEGESSTNLTERARAGDSFPEGRYIVAKQVRSGNSPWHGNRCYVNLLSPGVTDKFLELTMEPYRREVGKEFGRRIPGVFTDEPNIRPAGGFPWSEILLQQFQKRWGYDLREHLPSLARPVGDWRRIRHNYFQLLNEQFIANWAQPYHDYCESNHLEFTGHYWDHEWPNCIGVPDNMAMYAWHQRPAIDCLMNQYAEHTHAQFGNVRMVRELSSVANQLGQSRTLCEVYGAGGWDLRFEDMKRIGDWLEVLGVNTLNQHLSYITIRGARKRDHPQSFSYHEPWWEAYHVSAQYFARVSAALSQGQQVNKVLVLEPTSTAWMYQGDDARLSQIGDTFFKFLMALESAQIEYDLGCEDIIARHGSVQAGELRIGNRSYTRVIVPPNTENLNHTTRDLLQRLEVTVIGQAPRRVDGTASSTQAADAAVADTTETMRQTEQLINELRRSGSSARFRIDRQPADQGTLLHHRRILPDGELVFLVNTSLEHPSLGKIHSDRLGVERWDPYSGKVEPYRFEREQPGVAAEFALPPSGSLLLCLDGESTKSQLPQTRAELIDPVGSVLIARIEPNVLTLDYVDVTAGGETLSNTYFYAANQFVWKKNGMERDPWDSAVQFKDELISKKFPSQSGFEASYRFTIESAVPPDLAMVIERPDLYTITCNGQLLRPDPKNWWLDRSFVKIPVAPYARLGENVVGISATPFTMFHELESAYLLGDFAVMPAGRGFTISPPVALSLGSAGAGGGKSSDSGTRGWNSQGMPFYAAGVVYQERFELPRRSGQYAVSLREWYGSVASVKVNGKLAGYIDAPPWECDVSRQMRRGQNEVEVTVFGTLKNTLGPHHGKPALGAAWPSAFHVGPSPGPPPGSEYHTVGYGLFQPFVLKHTLQTNGD